MSIERDKDFEQLEDIAAMMAENPGIEFENGKYVYYGLDPRTAFAVVYIGGAWAGWQAKAQAVQDQFDVNSILHDIDCYFDNGLSNTERTANNLLQSIYEKLSGEFKAKEPKFNLDEFLVMEEKLKSKDSVIAADLDRFIAYAEMVLEKAKALKEPK